MKKEILLAIVIGLTCGLIITYGVYRARTSLSQPPINSSASPLPTSSPEASGTTNLRLVSPDDESIQTDKRVTVAGGTLPGSYVVIFINETEYITTADDSGNFSVQGDLEAGSNIIMINVMDENGNATIQERTVILVSAEKADAPASTSSATKAN